MPSTPSGHVIGLLRGRDLMVMVVGCLVTLGCEYKRTKKQMFYFLNSHFISPPYVKQKLRTMFNHNHVMFRVMVSVSFLSHQAFCM